MKLLLYCATLCLLTACGTSSQSSRLQEGQWTGGLTPMNHPDMSMPLAYDVGYEGDALTLALSGPGGMEMPARDVALQGDTLHFVFDEPEEGVPLQCALGRQAAAGSLEGRCTDAEGKWARFTMTPPAE